MNLEVSAMNLKKKPVFTQQTIQRMEDFSWFTHCQIFDDLLVVAQKETSCFVWQTAEGLVEKDGIWPSKAVYDAIISAIIDVGWNPEDIYKYVITHGHVDHTGCGKWLVDRHKAKTYLSKVDDQFWREHPTKPDRPETWKDFEIDCYIDEGETIDAGDKKIFVCGTPGHTPGCLSYLFPVMENGVQHMAALFGGATPPWNDQEGTKQYLDSIDHFIRTAKTMHVDVALSNHTIFDQGIDRINYSKNRCAYMPNIFVLGEDGFERFCEVYKALAVE